MATAENFLGPMKAIGMSAVTWIIVIVIGVIVLAGLGWLAVWARKKKKWNLRAIIRLPRKGKVINTELGKGHYSAKEGIVDIKRKGIPPIGSEPFDIREFVQGNNVVDFLQLGPEEYIPIDPGSYTIVTYKDKDGKEKRKAIMEIKANLERRKVWKTYFERTSKNRFTIQGLMDKYGRAIEMGVIIFTIFLGFSILWIRLGA